MSVPPPTIPMPCSASERACVRAFLDHASPVILELPAKGFAQAHRLGGEDVRVKAALDAGEHRGLEAPGERVRARQDESAPGATQGLGRGR